MNNEVFSIQKLAYLLISICLLVYIIIVGKDILTPLAFAAVLAFLLKSLCSKVENIITSRPLSILVSFLIILIPFTGVIYLFSMQFMDIFENMSSIENKIEDGINELFIAVNQNFGFSKREAEEMISENSASIIEKPLGFLGSTLSFSSTFILNFFLTFVYTFLLLLYRSSLKQFYLIQFGDKIKEGAETVLERIQFIIQKYLYGLILVIGILGVFNSIGLTLIGVDYAIFWGFLAAFLAVIPYVGTTLGGLLPFFYALASTGSFWQPMLIVLWFGFVQVVEGNLITPKIIGSSVKINPLAAIISLFIGASIWGVAGMILSLPLVAIIRIIFNQIDHLKPVGLLLSDELAEKEDVFEEKFDQKKFRLFNFLKRGKK